MLEKVKLSLRISHNALDAEIQDCINACFMDMQRVGVKLPENLVSDALICQAVKLYARWHFDYEQKAERYHLAYDSLRDSLSLDGDYHD